MVDLQLDGAVLAAPLLILQAVRDMFFGFGILASIGICILFMFLPAVKVHTPLAKQDATSLALNSDTGSLLAQSNATEDDGAPASAVPSVSLYETAKLAWSSRPMQLLIPIIFYNGASLGFFSASFPLLYQVTQ